MDSPLPFVAIASTDNRYFERPRRFRDLGDVTLTKQLRADVLVNKTRDAIKKFFAIIEDFRYTNHGASPFFCCVWFSHLYYSKYKGLVPFCRADSLEFMRFSKCI